MLVLLLLVGCETGPRKAGAVDAKLARKALETTLNTWKRGEEPKSLRAATPAIIAQDRDWEAGRKLVDYQLVGEGMDDTANLRYPVKLTIRNEKGTAISLDVIYVIGTDPVITVFREIY
jgi:hypothetical protein